MSLRIGKGALLLGLLAVTVACLQPVDPYEEPPMGEDGGMGGGADGGVDGGDPDSGVAPDAGGGDGGEGDGGDGGGGGELLDAGPSLSWSIDEGVDTFSSTANGVHGSGAANVYAVGASGGSPRMWRWVQPSWTAVTLPLGATGPLQDVFVFPGGAVFAAGDEALLSCSSDCATGGTLGGAYTVTSVSNTPQALCGDLSTGRLFAFGFDPDSPVQAGTVYEYLGGWGTARDLLAIANIQDCHLRAGDEVYLAGRSRLGRYDGSAVAPLDPVFPDGVDGDVEQFFDLWGTELPDGGYRLFAAASGGRIYETDGIAAPVRVFQAATAVDYRAIAGFGEEAFALPVTADGTAARFTPLRGWEALGDPLPFDVQALWAAGRDQYVAVGRQAGTAQAAHGTR